MNSLQNTILLVDDEVDVCNEFSIFLERKGYVVKTANNGLEAMRVAKKQHLDLVITDYNMPEINGIELLRELGNLIPDVPVIMMSGVADMKTGMLALKENAFDFLPKPVDSTELLQVIIKALDRAKRKLEKTPEIENTQYLGLLSHVQIGETNKITTISIHAALDEVNQKRLQSSFDKLLAEQTINKRIILMLNQVTYINNVGLKFLIDLSENLRKKNHIVILAMLSDPVHKYLRALGYLDYFEVAANRREAVELFE